MFIPSTPNTFAPSMRRQPTGRTPVSGLLDGTETMRSPFNASPITGPQPPSANPGFPTPQRPTTQPMWQYAPQPSQQVNEPITKKLLDEMKKAAAEEESDYYTMRDLFPGVTFTPSQMAPREIEAMAYQPIAPVVGRR